MQEKTVTPAVRIHIVPDHVAVIVDATDEGSRTARDIDTRDAIAVPQKAMARVDAIGIGTHELATVVDTQDCGAYGVWHVDGGKETVGRKKAMAPIDVVIAANHLPAVVDLGHTRRNCGARDINGREGIRSLLSHDKGTEQKTQGQHSRQP